MTDLILQKRYPTTCDGCNLSLLTPRDSTLRPGGHVTKAIEVAKEYSSYGM